MQGAPERAGSGVPVGVRTSRAPTTAIRSWQRITAAASARTPAASIRCSTGESSTVSASAPSPKDTAHPWAVSRATAGAGGASRASAHEKAVRNSASRAGPLFRCRVRSVLVIFRLGVLEVGLASSVVVRASLAPPRGLSLLRRAWARPPVSSQSSSPSRWAGQSLCSAYVQVRGGVGGEQVEDDDAAQRCHDQGAVDAAYAQFRGEHHRGLGGGVREAVGGEDVAHGGPPFVRDALVDVVTPLVRPALAVDEHEVVVGGALLVAVALVHGEEGAVRGEHEGPGVRVVVARARRRPAGRTPQFLAFLPRAVAAARRGLEADGGRARSPSGTGTELAQVREPGGDGGRVARRYGGDGGLVPEEFEVGLGHDAGLHAGGVGLAPQVRGDGGLRPDGTARRSGPDHQHRDGQRARRAARHRAPARPRARARRVAALLGPPPQAGREAALELLSGPTPPSGIVAVNDVFALGVCAGVRDAGLTVGREVSVVGYDDIVLARMATPALTTVRQPVSLMAEAAFGHLHRLIGGGSAPGHSELHRPELVARDSTGPVAVGAVGAVGEREGA